MLNKKGQSLILFIIMIPIIIGVFALIIESGNLIYHKHHLENVTKSIIKDNINKEIDLNKIKDYFKENDIDIENLEVIKNDDALKIKNKINVNSVFAGFIGKDTFTIKVDMIGSLKDNKIEIKKVGD